jgi:hypothetical protein
MKPIYAAALLALGAGACADSPPTLQLFQATPPDPSCAVPTNSTGGLLRGTLDTVYAEEPEDVVYRMGFIVRTTLSGDPVTVGETPVDNVGALTIYVNELQLSYQLSYQTVPATVEQVDASVPVYAAFQPETPSALLVSLFTGDVQKKLLDATRDRGETVEVVTTVRLIGETAGGDSVESNAVPFPLTVFRSDPAQVCPVANQRPGPSVGPCDPRGQNGARAACVAGTTTTP